MVKTPKSTSLAGNMRLSPHWSQYKDRDAERNVQQKLKKGIAQNVRPKFGCSPRRPRVNRSLPNFACWFVSRMCFLVLSFRRIGRQMWALCGSKFSFSQGTSLIQQLVATAQAVIFRTADNRAAIGVVRHRGWPKRSNSTRRRVELSYAAINAA